MCHVWLSVAPMERLHPQDCAEIYRLGITEDGIYTIQPDLEGPAKCDMETVGGGWTVIQNRQDGLVDFNRTWQEYREGFGNPQGEHWLGNAALHALTSAGQHQLRIELEDWYQQKRQMSYRNPGWSIEQHVCKKGSLYTGAARMAMLLLC
uniref:Fibrinogen C-terminal domain-containing protein n=1 Tax=Nothobranchius furzeri TaxID=105023 RepID=A0A8C6M8A9_NOTFU